MIFHVEFSEPAKKEFSKLDRFTQRIIFNWIIKNLEGTENPRIHGKPLTANRVGQWRYRIGDYRIIAEIRDNELIILLIGIGHRREVYEK